MSRYVVKSGLWRAPIDEEWPREFYTPDKASVDHPTVYEREDPLNPTGLVDASGQAIFRDDRRKVGYL